MDLADRARENYRRIEDVLGHKFAAGFLVGDAVIRGTFKSRMTALSSLLLRQQATDRARASAFRRVITCAPPNSAGHQEAKDSLLWEQLMELPAGSSVSFITADADFYADKSRSALAPSLREQAAAAQIEVQPYNDCATLLTARKPNQPIVNEAVVQSAIERLVPAEVKRVFALTEIEAFAGGVATSVRITKLSLFLTESRASLPS
jgi:hypothetical protein